LVSSHPFSYSAPDRVLCLSNGHGEDVIAIRILEALQKRTNAPQLAALPLVGEGRVYQQMGIPLIGPVKTMPSGGFIYMDGRQLARDLQGGLLQLTLNQFRTIRQWAKQGGSILAVGDIVPLLLAYLSGAPYAFVGTAKSEYYLRDENGNLFPKTAIDGWSGSVYYPWERWLMSRPRCRAVFPRDRLTSEMLQKWEIPAFDLGNPMMDGLEPNSLVVRRPEPMTVGATRQWQTTPAIATATTVYRTVSWGRPDKPAEQLSVVLLPGSRPPEAYENWQLILQAVDGLLQTAGPETKLTFLGAIAPSLDLETLAYWLQRHGWQLQPTPSPSDACGLDRVDAQALQFKHHHATLILTQRAFAECLHLADWAIAMAGTATEQFVGLGKPAIIMPGQGPQFTYAFAEAQTRLLGPSVTLVDHPAAVAPTLLTLQQHPDRLEAIAQNGYRRMGTAGAATRIADCLMTQLK